MTLFGWCSGIVNANLISQIGYDFIEIALHPLKLEDKKAYDQLIKPVLSSPIPTRAFNAFFPQDIKIVGPEFNSSRIRNYIALAAETLVRANAEIVVLGSGISRYIPDGWDEGRAEEQFLDVLSWIADELKGTHVTLAIEPLYREETNFINSLDEGVSLAEQVNRKEITVLADYFHMDEENESLDNLIKHKDWISHIHLADTGRRNPGSGNYDYDTFVSIVKEMNYKGMISTECFIDDLEAGLNQSMTFIKEKWKL